MITASNGNLVEQPAETRLGWPPPAEIIAAYSRGRHLRPGEIDRFVHRGVAQEALFFPDPVLAAEVVFLTNGYFEFSDHYYDGTPDYAFIMIVEADGGVIDIAAWQPKTGRIALWLNRAFALGEEQIWLPRLDDDPLRIWRTPMKWLATGRRGLVIVRAEAAFCALGNLPSIVAEDVAHGNELETLLTPPKPRTRILVPERTHSINQIKLHHREAT